MTLVGSRALHPRFLVAAGFYATALMLILLPQTVLSSGAQRASLAIQSIVLLIFAAFTLISLLRKPDEARIVLFMYFGIVASLTSLLMATDFAALPRWALYPFCLLHSGVYGFAFAIFIHMALQAFDRHRFVARRRTLAAINYASAVVVTAFLLILLLDERGLIMPDRDLGGRAVRRTILFSTYLYTGVVSLVIFGSAARLESTPTRRTQAWLIFAGLLPWTLNVGRTLWFPASTTRMPALALLEPITIAIMATSIFIAMFGFHLFELRGLVRKGLIYAPAMEALAAALYLILSGMSSILQQLLGVQPNTWVTGAALIVAGAALQPLSQVTSRQLDRW